MFKYIILLLVSFSSSAFLGSLKQSIGLGNKWVSADKYRPSVPPDYQHPFKGDKYELKIPLFAIENTLLLDRAIRLGYSSVPTRGVGKFPLFRLDEKQYKSIDSIKSNMRVFLLEKGTKLEVNRVFYNVYKSGLEQSVSQMMYIELKDSKGRTFDVSINDKILKRKKMHKSEKKIYSKILDFRKTNKATVYDCGYKRSIITDWESKLKFTDEELSVNWDDKKDCDKIEFYTEKAYFTYLFFGK